MKSCSAAEMMRLSMQITMMTIEAQSVVAMRLMGMAGGWNTTPGENKRMVREKSTAAIASGVAAGAAMLAGKSPAGIGLAATKPFRQKTRANAARLTKRGPKLPG